MNRRALLQALVRLGPRPRSDLAATVGLTEASVSRITRDLLRSGLLEEVAEQAPTGRPGRRGIDLKIRSEGAHVVGIGMNAFEQEAVVTNIGHEVVARRALPLSGVTDHEAILQTIAGGVSELLASAGIDRRRVLGVGIACAGTVDPIAGVVRNSPTLHWKELSIAAELEQRIHLPCRLEGTGNAVIMAEAQSGHAANIGHAMIVTAALGLGGAMVLDGRIVHGHRFRAGQFSRIAVPDPQRPHRRGKGLSRLSLDEVGAGRGVLSRLNEPMSVAGLQAYDPAFAAIRLFDVIDRAVQGDNAAKAAFFETGAELGRILSPVLTATSPELLLVGGPVSLVQDYVKGIRAAIREYAPIEDGVPYPALPEVKRSMLSNAAAAARLAVDAFLLSHGLDSQQLSDLELSA